MFLLEIPKTVSWATSLLTIYNIFSIFQLKILWPYMQCNFKDICIKNIIMTKYIPIFTVLDSTQMSLIFPFFHQLLLSMQVGQSHFLIHYKNRTSYKTIILLEAKVLTWRERRSMEIDCLWNHSKVLLTTVNLKIALKSLLILFCLNLTSKYPSPTWPNLSSPLYK